MGALTEGKAAVHVPRHACALGAQQMPHSAATEMAAIALHPCIQWSQVQMPSRYRCDLGRAEHPRRSPDQTRDTSEKKRRPDEIVPRSTGSGCMCAQLWKSRRKESCTAMWAPQSAGFSCSTGLQR